MAPSAQHFARLCPAVPVAFPAAAFAAIVLTFALTLSAATVTTPVEGDAPIFGYPSVSLVGDQVSIAMGAGRVGPIFDPACAFDRPCLIWATTGGGNNLGQYGSITGTYQGLTLSPFLPLDRSQANFSFDSLQYFGRDTKLGDMAIPVDVSGWLLLGSQSDYLKLQFHGSGTWNIRLEAFGPTAGAQGVDVFRGRATFRGELSEVPEPSAMVPLAAIVLVLAVALRRRHRTESVLA